MIETQATLVTLLLDRSGSMAAVRDATIEAFNAYLEELRAEPDPARPILFSFVQFDSIGLDKVFANRPVADAPLLDQAGFVPRGSTPLIDAAFTTIKAVETAVAKRGDQPKVVVCIQTDGHENCSTEHTWLDLNLLIKEKTLAGWEFVFMGAGIDAYDQGAQMGVSADRTLSYSLDPEATRAAFSSSGENTRRFAAGLAVDTSYSAFQRLAAGERPRPSDAARSDPKPFGSTTPRAPRTPSTAPRAPTRPIVDPLEL